MASQVRELSFCLPGLEERELLLQAPRWNCEIVVLGALRDCGREIHAADFSFVRSFVDEERASGITRRDGSGRLKDNNIMYLCLLMCTLFSNFWLILANFERPVLGCIDADF